jgi:predicted permease
MTREHLMSGVLMAAMVAPVVLLLVALLLGRVLRSTDRLEEERRSGSSPTAVRTFASDQRTGVEDRPVSAAILGAGGS